MTKTKKGRRNRLRAIRKDYEDLHRVVWNHYKTIPIGTPERHHAQQLFRALYRMQSLARRAP